MKLQIDREADALYLRLDESRIVESEVVSPGAILDCGEHKKVVGIEMLHLSRRMSRLKVHELPCETT